mgnify:FL=1
MRPFANYISLGVFIAVATPVYCVARRRVEQLAEKIAQIEQQIADATALDDDSFESASEVFRLSLILSDLNYRKDFWLRLAKAIEGSFIIAGVVMSTILIITLIVLLVLS